VAVIDRNWLEFVLGAFERRGAKVQAAWPAQLALPMTGKGNWSLLCLPDGLALRSDATAGIGWPAGEDAQGRQEALTSLLANAGECAGGKVVVFALDDGWQEPIDEALADLELTIDGKMHRMPAPQEAPVDLLSGRVRRGALGWVNDINWRAWRWPGALAAAALVAWLLGLNVHWAQLAQERNELRAALETTLRRTFPETKVVVDPVLQMEREVSALRTRAGQSGPGDFVPLLARLGQALGAQSLDSLASVDYREGALRIKFKPAVVQSRAARDSLLEACRRVGLRLEFDQPRESSLVAAVTVM
jgi:type II secretion system protein L